MKFHYKAQNTEGAIIDGEMEAFDQADLIHKIKIGGDTVIFVEPLSAKRFSFLVHLNNILGKVHLKDKVFFARNIGIMVGAGLPLVRALSILERQTRNNAFKDVLVSLGESITKGKSLHEALVQFPHVFSPLAIAMVRSGEASGTLTESLHIIGEHLEESYQIQKRVQGALMYPAVIITAMLGIGVAMMVYVVPTLTATFIDLGVPLPALTQAIISVSDFLRYNGLWAVAILMVIGIFIFLFLKRPEGQRAFHFLFLRAPLLGEFTKKINAARTARTLSSLLSSGVAMVEAVSITEEVVQNVYYKEMLKKAEEKLQKGVSLSEIFSSREDLYPVLVGEMIRVGEETGKLSSMLGEIAKFFEGEIEQATKNLGTIIEPVLMIVMGGAVGIFAYAMMTPLYSVLEGI